MVIGIILGDMVFTNFPDKKAAAQIVGYISIMSDVFLRLIKILGLIMANLLEPGKNLGLPLPDIRPGSGSTWS